jgi:endonuclease G
MTGDDMENLTERVRRAVAAIEQRDDKLAEELNAVRERVRRDKEGLAEAADPSLETMVEPGGISTLAQETIVLRTGRPVLAITNNEVRFEVSDSESEIWRDRLRVAREVIDRAVLAVGRIDVANNPRFDWVGTGWLVAEDIIVTNRHVAAEFGRNDGARFVFRSSSNFGTMSASIDFLHEVDSQESNAFDIQGLLHIEPEDGPDMAFLRVRPRDGRNLAAPIALAQSAPAPAEQVAVIGYPARDSRIPEVDLMDHIFGNVYNRKRLAPGQLIGVHPVEVEHDCSTLGGNSGSVVLSLKSGEAVGLHFSGQFLKANYAVPATLVADRLKAIQSGGGARRPAPDARLADDRPQQPRPASEQSGAPQTQPPAEVTFQLPLTISVRFGSPVVSPAEPATVTPVTPPASPAPPPPRPTDDEGEVFTEGRPEDYADREGYLTGFIEGYEVPLPAIKNQDDILTFEDGEREEYVLRYQHFSVVMSASRRMCFYSAVNINGKLSRRQKRGPWKIDGRIPKEAQIIKECYGNPPKFARGHMTRREDPIWGDEDDAARGNTDSMHVTNAVPQMQPFNAGVWLGLEDYALDHTRDDDMSISVFTGPFFSKNDPIMYGVKIPITFWKVIAFIHDETGKLCATGYTMSQRPYLQREEFVFGQHEKAQQPIAVIEQRAGLDFGRLTSFDPLRGNNEAPSGLLTDFSQIKFV